MSESSTAECLDRRSRRLNAFQLDLPEEIGNKETTLPSKEKKVPGQLRALMVAYDTVSS